MLGKKVVLVLFVLTMTLSTANGQTSRKSDRATKNEDLLSSVASIGQILQDAENLRIAAQSMEKFGKSLEHGVTGMSETVTSTSENLALMSSGFDPLGLQNAFKTIQQQNEIIRRQQITIQALQKAEIRRLKKENRRLRQERKSNQGDLNL